MNVWLRDTWDSNLSNARSSFTPGDRKVGIVCWLSRARCVYRHRAHRQQAESFSDGPNRVTIPVPARLVAPVRESITRRRDIAAW